MKVNEGIISRVLNRLMKKLEKMQDANWDDIMNDPKIAKMAVKFAHDLEKEYSKK